MPPSEYALLLGTFPHTPTGERNPGFDNRIKSAIELYGTGKIKKIIASGGDYLKDENGSHRENGYNKLRSMRDSLEHLEVPFDFVTLDYDGTTTLNSIVKGGRVILNCTPKVRQKTFGVQLTC